MHKVISFALIVGCLAVAGGAVATGFPDRPLQLVIPFPPGGLTDVQARPIAPAFEKLLRQPVVIENRGGAAGAIGTQYVAHAKPDGYTMLFTSPAVVILPEVDKVFGRKPGFTLDDFIPIGRISADAPVMVVPSGSSWKSVADVVAAARQSPGTIPYGSAGVFGPTHLPMELFAHAADIKLRHVGYQGGGPAMTALLGGHVQLLAAGVNVAQPHIKNGGIRPLAVWSAKRHPALPNVPTLTELGYRAEIYLWVGMFAPKATPPDVVDVWRTATRKAISDTAFKEAMGNLGTPIDYLDRDEFAKFLAADQEQTASIVRLIGRVK